MFGYTFANLHLGGPQACGRAVSVSAKQVSDKLISVTWAAEAVPDPDSVVFLVYLDGTLLQRLPGSTRSTTLMAPNTDPHDVTVEAWPATFTAPEDAHGDMATMRAHLFWTETDPTVAGYFIYIAATDLGAYSLYATHNRVSVPTVYKPLGTTGYVHISGSADDLGHTNSTLTLTVTDADLRIAELTNDLNADVVDFAYEIGQQATPIGGITITITGAPADADSITFFVGVAHEYDSGILAEGTHWFKLKSYDQAGNVSGFSGAVGLVITPPPDPVQFFELGFSGDSGQLYFNATQSATVSVDKIRVYSNYDSVSNTFLSSVNFDYHYSEVLVDPGVTTSDNSLVSAPPDGIYQFVARAVTSAGIDDQTSVIHSITIPYVPASLPLILSIEAIAIEGGGVRLSWLANAISEGGWLINGIGVTVTINAIDITATADNTDAFRFTYDIPAGEVGPEDTYTIHLAAWNLEQTITGTPASVTITTDSTAPAAPSGLMGIPF